MALFSTAPPPPPRPLLPLRHRHSPYAPPPIASTLPLSCSKLASRSFVCSSSSSSLSTSVAEDEGSPLPTAAEIGSVAPPDSESLPLSGCSGCGREQIESGCNGKGRIQGGIATFPGLGWWPIKAYRPCPGFLASGGRYKRQGQSMDEVVSGGR